MAVTDVAVLFEPSAPTFFWHKSPCGDQGSACAKRVAKGVVDRLANGGVFGANCYSKVRKRCGGVIEARYLRALGLRDM
jgi:hypothetical protein